MFNHKKISSKLMILAICTAFLIMNITVLCAVSIDSSFDGAVILGKPDLTSVTANITANKESRIYLSWGASTNQYSNKSDTHICSQASPAEIVMDGLKANTKYYYRIYFQLTSESQYRNTMEYSFNTPKSEGNDFSFVIQSDSHLLNKADKDLYKQSMQNMASCNPDFMIDMGDTFLNDQVSNPQYLPYETVRQTYFQQRAYFDIVTRNSPLFYVLGNHEGEYGSYIDGTNSNLAVTSANARKLYYPNPVPNSFYTGNSNEQEFIGLPENYYSYQWGDALFVMIDPYRYTMSDPYSGNGGWDSTLGEAQYKWFRKTLETSTAKYKFVFAHHAIGNIRGGLEVAKLYEWGGYDKNGEYLFDKKRPGWGKPIQQIMKDTGVDIFFQGHDHLFARENVDGVIYQTLPKPAEKIPDAQSNYVSYPNGDVLLNSGFLKVDVNSDKVTVDYYRNYFVSTLPQDGNTGVVYSYSVDGNQNVDILKSTKDDLTTYGSVGGTTKQPKSKDPNKQKTQKGTKGQKGALSDALSIKIDGQLANAEVPPFIDSNGRTLVPIRFIAEQLGCEVLWQDSGEENTVTIKNNTSKIKLKIGENVVYINGIQKPIDTTAILKDDRTFVPLRFIAEALGVSVEWDSETKTVIITTGNAQASLPVTSNTGDFIGKELLGAPTDTSVNIKVVPNEDMILMFEYGTSSTNLSIKTDAINCKTGVATEEIIEELQPDTQYYYRMLYKGIGEAEYKLGNINYFHTQRNLGEAFSFDIQADSHRDDKTNLELYKKTLTNILSDKPDFLIDLGDTFMAEKFAKSESELIQSYIDGREFFDIVGGSVPLFLVNGNHEGENGWELSKNSNGVATWAENARNKYFENPTPNTFYTGNDRRSYYAWTWGDALFVVLDPFWYSEIKPKSFEEGWNYTLGKEQYDWFSNVLENSKSKYKFVFSHNLVGGTGKDARGGIDAAKYFEWGGLNADGTNGFSANRANWGEPIHQLMVDNKVTAFFYGHDHFFAKQELDGVIYQLVPQPGNTNYNDVRQAEEYGYKNGVFMPPSGHLRVNVSNENVTVDYVRSYLDKDQTSDRQNNSVGYSYNIYAK